MRRVVMIMMALLMGVSVARAQGGEQAVLRRVAEYVKGLGSYDVTFSVKAGDYTTAGSYSVAGDAYYILFDVAEVYSDGKTRYEVDNDRKEVSVDVVDLESRNILDNPTRCFDFVGDDYAAQIVKQDSKQAVLQLVAQDEEQEGEIVLTVDKASGKPLAVSYLLYDDRVDVEIKSFASRKEKIKSFSKALYKDYDIVDFR